MFLIDGVPCMIMLKRLFTLFEPLKFYFNKYGNDEQNNYLSKENEVHFNLLLCLLKKLNVYIKFFQKEKT